MILFLDQNRDTRSCYPWWCCVESCCTGWHTVVAILRKHFPQKFVPLNQLSRNLGSRTFHFFLNHTLLYFKPCCRLQDSCIISLWWAHVFYPLFLLIEADCGWSSMSLFPTLKTLYPLFDTVGAHAVISICMLKLCVNIWYRNSFLNTKILSLHIAEITYPCQPFSCTEGAWGGQATFSYSGVRQLMEVVIIHCVLQHCMTFVYNFMMFVTFCVTFTSTSQEDQMLVEVSRISWMHDDWSWNIPSDNL